MSEQFIDTSSDEYLDAPKALRDAYDKLKSRFLETAKERDTFKGRAEASALGDVLTGFVKPERVKSALLADGVDPLDTEAVKVWVEENGDDFAKATTETTTSTPSAQESSEAAAHQRIADAGALQQPADMGRWEAAQAEIPENATPDQVRQILLSKGL